MSLNLSIAYDFPLFFLVSRGLQGFLFDNFYFLLFQGPANKNCLCATCHGSFGNCPGHFGYLKLALPVYNVGYMSTIVDILKCICKVRELFPSFTACQFAVVLNVVCLVEKGCVLKWYFHAEVCCNLCI